MLAGTALALLLAVDAAAGLIMNAAAPRGMYRIANPPPGRSPYVAQNVSHRGRYIEVYSPNITTRYGDVFWTMMDSVPLPADFVKQYDGQVVAFTGYEADSVRAMPDGSEQHVPLYDQYNHHHNAYLLGKVLFWVLWWPSGWYTLRISSGRCRDVARASSTVWCGHNSIVS